MYFENPVDSVKSACALFDVNNFFQGNIQLLRSYEKVLNFKVKNKILKLINKQVDSN